MTQKIIILISFILLTSCVMNNKKKSDFDKCLYIVEDYANFRGELNDTILARFYFSIEYLERITNIDAKCVFSDVPYYKTRADYKSDIRKWRKWYDENMDYLTQERSDSLKLEIAKDNIWWSDSTILQYVFEIE
jgi:hypothetical protein